MKEKNIQELAIRMGLISVEDMCQHTIAQLVVKIANKVNELVGEVWRFETDVQEMLKTQNENIQYLLGEGLHLEVENIFDGWVQDGTFDTLLNHSALKSVNDRIDETNAQLSKIENSVDYVSKRISNRNFTHLFGISAYWGEASDNLGNCWLPSRDKITRDINTWNEHGCDEIVIPIHITYNQTLGKFFIVENLDDMRFAVDYCSGLDIKVTTIKIHLQKATETMIKKHGMDDFKRQYKTLIKELVNLFNNTSITIMTVFNEVGWLYENDEHESFVNECLDLVKAEGYLTGVTCAGFLNFYNIKKSVIYNSDKIFVNTYPRVSSKKEKTKLIDVLNGWNSNNIKEHIDKVKSIYPSKNIVISECGVQDYWISLTSPETFSWNDADKIPTNGESPNMFLLGLINTLKDEDVERVWWWYDLKWDVTKKTLNYYLKGVVNHD